LLVRTWGRFQQVDATTFTVDDGSGLNIKCTVAPGTFLYSGWQYVCVVGASSLYKFNASIYPPLVLVRDIEVLLPAYPCEMIYIPAGSFLMGNNGAEPYSYCQELPQHSVYLPGYWIGKYEVTRGEYQQFMSAGGYSNPAYWSSAGWSWKVSSGRTQPSYWAPVQDWGMGAFTQTDSHPVVGVSYYECEAFCNWAGGHLATEAQWEKAARWTGSYPNVYPWGNTWDPEKCNNYYDHNAAGGGYQKYQTAPVGSYPSGVSPYGLHDMAGNVWEWVQDWYVSYPGSPCPFNYTGSSRVLRGGGWSSYVARYARCAYRLDNYPDYYWNDGGFRLAR
jgi:formylglycine-generating enzyme required for sulfatase activity